LIPVILIPKLAVAAVAAVITSTLATPIEPVVP
jgi:hypothetical protein